jgi:hypothetical protein
VCVGLVDRDRSSDGSPAGLRMRKNRFFSGLKKIRGEMLDRFFSSP